MSLFVLVVDDEADIEMLFRQHFRKELRGGDFSMEFALDAPEALSIIDSVREATLILILSDINMPGMSGLELLPKARAARPEVPIIMISAYGDSETQQKALQGGAEGFFTKPIDFARLREEIRQRVEQAA